MVGDRRISQINLWEYVARSQAHFVSPCEIVAQIKSIYCNHPVVRRRRQQRAYPAIKGVKLARDLIAQDIEMHVKGHPPHQIPQQPAPAPETACVWAAKCVSTGLF